MALLRILCAKALPMVQLLCDSGLLLVFMGTAEGGGKFIVRWLFPKA